MKRILVTGIAGFIGFHAARALLERGDVVVGIDIFNDYYDPGLKRERASFLPKVIEGNILDQELLRGVLEEEQITHVLHLAAQAGVRYSLENPKAYLETNVDGFLVLLEVLKDKSIPLIYASSSSVYGLNDNIPFSEEDRVDQQASLYGVTKKCNELMARTYHHLYGLSVTGLRFFTVYGPYGRPDMAYFSFAEKMMRQEPISLFNHGEMLRDFTYIDDIVQGTLAAIDLAAPCEVFNLGNHQPVTLKVFVETLEKALGVRAIKRFLPMQPGDVVKTYADITKSQKRLHFYPQTSLEEGLEKFAAWFHGRSGALLPG